uniref:CSON002850 protein n=1 Tax=Culicoides sonorensis TaxID=179676 RepID=A0A336MLQ8_CULSO
MKISREEYKNILYICKKFNISRESVHLKTLASILDKRLLRLRVVLRFSVKHKKNHHYLCYNSLKRFDIRRKYLKEKVCKSTNSLKSWRRAVRKVRQSNFIAYEEEDIVEHCETNQTVKEQSQQVRDKLKEQLQLLQLGKKNKQNDDVKIASVCKNDDTIQKSNINITNGNTDTQDSIHGECFDDDDEMDPLRVTPEIPNEVSDCEEHKKKIPIDLKTPIKNIEDELSEVESTTTPNLSDTGYNSPSITPSKKGFLDSLLNKFKPTSFEKKLQKDKIGEDFQEDKLPQPILIPLTVEPGQRTTRMRARKSVHQIKKEVEEVSVAKTRDSKENPFKVSEKQVPLLLPTPRAQNTKASAFVDQESAEEVKVKLEKIEEDELKNIDQKEHEGLVCSGMKPPHLDRPKKLVDLVRPRTVAEKRQLMQKKKGIKFLMMENESKIYNELAKINREDYDYQFNFPMLTALQKETVPYRRDAWRALSFLKTEKNRFFYKVVYVDGVKCNLLGSRGNFDGKKKFRAVCTPFPKYLEYRLRVPCCKPIKMPKNIKFNLDIPTEPAEPVAAKKLLDYDKIILNMKPGPLSEKLRKQTSRLSTDECLGPLELYTMPTVELELHPKLGRPIDPKIQPYFKYLLPYENITEKWARFSVSLLKENDKDIEDEKFSFPIEYSNNQNKIMIRRRKEMQANISVEDKILADDIEKPLNFAKTIDPDDKLGLEISQILTEMTNCVAIGLSESCFIQNDPDIDYDKTDKPLEIITPPKSVKDKSLSRRVVRELRKLNATFITADNQNGKCSESFCDKGCICESLSTSLTYKNHCKNQECMLECTCTSNRYHLNDEEIKDCSFTSDEVQSLREKATARLARVEKEFTPTLVLSNNSTYLIPGSDREHARRSKRAPKRFSDFVDSSKISTGPFDETNDIVPLSEPAKSKFTPKDPLEAAVYNMKHCNVVLRQLQHVNSIEPWCMVHRLYKCFCNGQATEGRPFTFDDLEERLEERYDYGTRKPIYEFERLDRKENGRRSFDQSVPVNSSTTKENAEKRLKRLSSSSSNNSKPDMEMPPTKLRRSSIAQPLVDLNSLDMEKFDTNVAQRCFPIDTKYQTRDPLETNLKKVAIKKYEEKHAYAEKLLQKRLTECERHFLEENRKNQPKATPAPNNSNATPIVQNPIERREFPKKKRKSVLNRPIRLNISNSEEEIEAIALLKPLVTKNMILVATGKNKILAKKDYFYAGKLDFTKVIEKTNNTIFIIEKTPEEQANNIDFLKCNRLVRRAKAVDINKVINIILQPDSADVKEIAASQESSQDDDSCSQSSVNIQDSDATYKDMGVQKIQHINMMISKAMQYICKLQKENSPKLIEPNVSKLYFFTWKCMLQGFQQNLLSVWEIKCEGNRKAVIVTQNETKPAIEQLESLKNIKECTAEMPELSLFSKMLLLKIDDERTKNLSLTLYGGTNFWRITGFVNSENDYQRNGVVARPTPETHPVLSAKINYLFNLLHNTSQKDTAIKKSAEQNDADKDKTNIKICSTDNMPTIKSLFLPIPEIPDQRWLMLQVENDFSDIFIPDWGDYLSYDKISCALTLAKEHSKTVRVTMNDKFPEIYATPHRANCIFFGPYRMNQDIDFILCQNVDGKWLLREDYEKKYNIKKENATFASWLYPKRDGEPSPRVIKPTAKVSTSENSSEPLPFKISHVQTAITDPNLIPILDSDEEQESVVVKNESMKRKSIDIIPSKTIEILPSKPEKRQKTDVPLKVTLLRKNGDAFEIKSKETDVKESSIQKKDSTIVRLSMPGVSSDKTAANVIGRRISLPLSALNSMKPVQQSQGGVSILKSTLQANKSTVDNQKPSTSKAIPKVSNNPEVGKSLLQQVVIQTPTGMQIKSIVKKHKKSVSPVKKSTPPASAPENKIKNLQQSLPSSISIIPVNSTQNKQPVIAKPPVTKETVSVQPNKPPIATPSTPLPTTSQKSITNSNSIPQADVVHGYYISSIPEIGRILAEKRGNRLVLKMRNCDGYYVRRQFLAGQSMQYLNRYLRGLILSFIPENYNLQWTFETSKQIIDKYPEHDPNKVPRKIIITEQGVVNLKQKWDDLTYLERLDKSQYLKILLIKLAEDCFPNQKFSNWDALQILQSAQKEIERLEAQTPQLAQTKIELQSKNSELLGKFDTLKSLYPDVKLEPDSSQASTEISSLFAQEISKETDSDDVEFVSFQKKGLEVICLDDDEDD